MSRLQIKKFTLQYAYLKIEEEEIKETCSLSEKEIRSYIQEKYPDFYNHTPEAPIEKENEAPENAEDKTQTPHDGDTLPKNKDLKKLYRKIASKTHPDKAEGNAYGGIFASAARAYKENNIAKLLEIAGALNMELSELSPESVALLKNNIETLGKKIHIMKQTAAWAWGSATTEQEKEQIVETILNSKGMSTKNEE